MIVGDWGGKGKRGGGKGVGERVERDRPFG